MMHLSALLLLCGLAPWHGQAPGAAAPAPTPAMAAPAMAAPEAATPAMAAPEAATPAMAAPEAATPAMATPPALMAPLPASGAPAMAAPPAMDGAGDWKPYDYRKAQAAKKGLAPGTLVVIAYGLIWGVLLVYVVLLARRQRRLREELDALRDLLSRTEAVPGRAGDEAAEDAGGRVK